VRRRPVTLVENGIVKRVVYARATARKLKIRCTPARLVRSNRPAMGSPCRMKWARCR
jgi:hypothetical protein